MQSPDGTGTIVSTRRRTWLVLGLAVLLVAAFSAHLLHQESLRREAAIDSAIDSAIENGPLTISVKLEGLHVGWNLEIDAAGNATLKDSSISARKHKTRKFVVSKAQFDELRKALLREHFFDLADAYVDLNVTDSSCTTLEVYAGDRIKTVRLGIETPEERARLREPSRALRVLQVILAWFDDPALNDMRKWNQKLIDAAGK
jgi:hypothetical protein